MELEITSLDDLQAENERLRGVLELHNHCVDYWKHKVWRGAALAEAVEEVHGADHPGLIDVCNWQMCQLARALLIMEEA